MINTYMTSAKRIEFVLTNAKDHDPNVTDKYDEDGKEMEAGRLTIHVNVQQ